MKKMILTLSVFLICIASAPSALAECRWDADAGIVADWDKYSHKIRIELYKGSTEYEVNRVFSSTCSADKETKDFTQTVIDTGPGTYTYVLKEADGSTLEESEPLQVSEDYYYELVLGNVKPTWQLSDGKWYLIDPVGKKLKGWHLVNEKWYYMGELTGTCYINCYTPDGYYVDETGAWDGNESFNNRG